MSRKPTFLITLLGILVVALGLASGACGTIDMQPGGSSTTTSEPGTTTSTSAPPSSSSSTTLPPGAITHPTGATDVVLRITTGGGFVPIEFNYTLIPELTLYGDGRVIVTGPVVLIYPGPALPNLQTAVLPDETIQAILAAAKDAGLFRNGFDYGTPGVTDLPTTTIVINAQGTTFTSQIYALGFEDAPGLTSEQLQARAAVNDLRGKLSDPANFGAGPVAWEPYEFTALAVYSRAVDSSDTTDLADIRPNHLPWPLADLATAGERVSEGVRKVVVTGDDLDTLKPLLGQATQITLWRSGDTEYRLWFRPLLPDQAA
jgi:hypothetical protein